MNTLTSGDKKQETWNRCIVALKIMLIEYVKSESEYRIFINEVCLNLTLWGLWRTFANIEKKKKDFIFKGQELFIFSTAYQTQNLP